MADAGSTWGASVAAAGVDAMQVYDEVFVPRLFTPWAELLLDAVEPGAGEALLDVATGPGTVARLAAVRRAAAPITVNGVVRSETAAHVAVGYAP